MFEDPAAPHEADVYARFVLAAIVESSDDAIIGKSFDGHITSWNTAAERLYGYSAEEAIGQPISLIVPADRRDELSRIMEQIRRGERIDHQETVRVTKDGRLIDVSVSISPIKRADGVIIGASAIARDITARKRDEAERQRLLTQEQEARHAADAANRAKDEFLASLSHELRTPLTAILGWAHILRGNRDDPALLERAIDTIERNARQQAQLVEDLLDVSRIIVGKLKLDARPVSLVAVIAAGVESIRLAADAKQITLDSQLDPSADTVFGDPHRLQQVLWNLLSNAVKFTPRLGRIEVTLRRTDSQAVLSVTDTGQGIRSEMLPFLFERFWQADTSTARAHGGLGLGLAIVRHLTELHGGTVHANSAGEGQGATFTIRLPLASVRTSEMPLPVIQPTIAGRCAGLRVLVVEDEADSREMIRLVLAACGADVVTATSCPEALAALEHDRFAVIVSDLAMPGEDGYTLIRQVRALPPDRGGRVPAIALTAHAGAQVRVQALLAGFTTHLAKPVEPTELAAVVAMTARASGTLPPV